MAYGTLTTLDTLLSTFQSVASFDEARLAQTLQTYLDAHNKIMLDFMDDLIMKTTEIEGVYGTASSMEMSVMDQHGAPDAQKIAYGVTYGIPLKSIQGRLQWTRKYFQTATVAEVTYQFLGLQAADRQRVTNEAKAALFSPTNYTWDEPLANSRTVRPLNVRALLNADSNTIPPGPNGETFNGATHTHYLGTASFVQADLIALLETVLEHYNEGEARIYINRAQEATVRGFANFVPYLNAGYVGPTTSTQTYVQSLDTVALYDRPIGQINGAEIWVKPWIPASYVFAFLKNRPKPLSMRTRTAGGGGLELVAQNEQYPLRSEIYEREYGLAVSERSNGACLFTGNSTYTAPTIVLA